MIRGIIFDLDGVLTHTNEQHFQAWSELAQQLGASLPDQIKDDTRGISRMDSLAVVLAAIGQADRYSPQERFQLADTKNKRYQKLIEQFTSANLEPGAVELLQQLHAMGIKIALASASKNASTLIDRLDISHWFDYVIDPAKIKQGKPHPEMFLTAASELGLTPQECLGVEDAASGVEAIQQAGMKAIGIGTDAVVQADWRFETLVEAADWLIVFLKEQNNGKR